VRGPLLGGKQRTIRGGAPKVKVIGCPREMVIGADRGRGKNVLRGGGYRVVNMKGEGKNHSKARPSKQRNKVSRILGGGESIKEALWVIQKMPNACSKAITAGGGRDGQDQ